MWIFWFAKSVIFFAALYWCCIVESPTKSMTPGGAIAHVLRALARPSVSTCDEIVHLASEKVWQV